MHSKRMQNRFSQMTGYGRSSPYSISHIQEKYIAIWQYYCFFPSIQQSVDSPESDVRSMQSQLRRVDLNAYCCTPRGKRFLRGAASRHVTLGFQQSWNFYSAATLALAITLWFRKAISLTWRTYSPNLTSRIHPLLAMRWIWSRWKWHVSDSAISSWCICEI